MLLKVFKCIIITFVVSKHIPMLYLFVAYMFMFMQQFMMMNTDVNYNNVLEEEKMNGP